MEYLFDTAAEYRESELGRDGRTVSRMPTYIEGYGDILDGDTSYVVKYLNTENVLPPAMERYFDSPHDQNVHEVRVCAEMEERGQDFMPDIVAWADDFSWLVMEEAEDDDVDPSVLQDDLMDGGWAPFDIGVGLFDGDPKVYDAGLMPRMEDDWRVSREELEERERSFSVGRF